LSVVYSAAKLLTLKGKLCPQKRTNASSVLIDSSYSGLSRGLFDRGSRAIRFSPGGIPDQLPKTQARSDMVNEVTPCMQSRLTDVVPK